MRRITIIIDALNIILKRIGETSEDPQTIELREKALSYLDEALLWRNARPRPPAEKHEALTKKVLALHVELNELRSRAGAKE